MTTRGPGDPFGGPVRDPRDRMTGHVPEEGRGGQEAEDDPTGIRALLSSLPDPGPMPDDVVRRISASIAQEQQAQGRDDRTVVPLAPRPWRLRVFTALAGAAAAVVLGVVGISLLSERTAQESAGGSASVLQSADDAGSGAAGAPEEDLRENQDSVAAPGYVPLVATGRDYSASSLPEDAAALWTSSRSQSGQPASPGPQTGPGNSGPQLAAAFPTLSDCLNALGVAPSDVQAAVADVGRYEGRPAVVIVVQRAGSRTAYVVGRQCSATDPALLATAPLP